MADKTQAADALKAKIHEFPRTPGVYVIRNKKREVLYVGKAKNLRSRVRSYFTDGKDIKTRFLVEKAADVEAILTSSEYEALILENTLIKRHRPRYNINLKDGKSYPVIRITSEPFPRVFRTRRRIRDGSTYFGPYPNVGAVDVYIDLIRKLFPLRRCKTLKSRDAPCLYHHIGRCPAPCVGKVTEEEYAKIIRKVKNLLSGKTSALRKDLNKDMRNAAESRRFERAAELRDALKSLDTLEPEPVAMDFREESRDYVDKEISGRYAAFAVLQMRGGKVTGQDLFVNEYAGDSAGALPEFLAQYYSETGRERPDRIYLSESVEDLLLRFFKEGSSSVPRFVQAVEKRDRVVQAMVRQNAAAELHQKILKEGDRPALEILQRVLSLPRVPRRIEGFDISHLQGRHTVASLISFVDGRPDRSGYRHYKIRSTADAVDDYKSIAEVVGRRYQRLVNEGLPKPDLILVDGGRGQVSSAHAVLQILDLAEKIPLVGLAKRREELWLPGSDDPVRLPEGDPGLRVLQHVRDETHRFATGYNQRLRSQDITLSVLKGAPGIGEKRATKLLKTYGSLKGIYARSAEEIAETAGTALEVAEIVQEFLGRTGLERSEPSRKTEKEGG